MAIKVRGSFKGKEQMRLKKILSRWNGDKSENIFSNRYFREPVNIRSKAFVFPYAEIYSFTL